MAQNVQAHYYGGPYLPYLYKQIEFMLSAH